MAYRCVEVRRNEGVVCKLIQFPSQVDRLIAMMRERLPQPMLDSVTNTPSMPEWKDLETEGKQEHAQHTEKRHITLKFIFLPRIGSESPVTFKLFSVLCLFSVLWIILFSS
jgi:hypothetical protein